MSRVLLRLKKDDTVKYISHLDLVKAFEFALRRAGIPIEYTEGFNPRPKMSFGGAIGVGVSSDDERFILELIQPVDSSEIMERLNNNLPPGLRILSAEQVPDSVKSPLTELNASDFRIIVSCADCSEIETIIRQIMDSSEYKITRVRAKGSKVVDIRQYIIDIRVLECIDDIAAIYASLLSTTSGGGRPQDIIQVLSEKIPDLVLKETRRLKQYHIDDASS
ncbi:MAG: TIGR03936 family radical SAM-associated protein [Armatimonadota bacterium]